MQEQQTSNYDGEEVQQEEAPTSGVLWKIPRITLRKRENNCWQVVLNKEEQELIDEFLET